MVNGKLSAIAQRAAEIIETHGLLASGQAQPPVLTSVQGRHHKQPPAPVLLMVSGGSDSTALAYVACELREAGLAGPLAMLHVNHHLRGADADADARFVEGLASLLGIPLFMCDVDVSAIVARTGENMEAVARRERYAAARDALRSHCVHVGVQWEERSPDEGCSLGCADGPAIGSALAEGALPQAVAPESAGRIFTAHTADDRVENFYMRSIVGTGPGGFRSMRYVSGSIARPLLDASREELRDYLVARAAAGLPVHRDAQGALWREDATNAQTDLFRGYVRHEIVPRAKARNARLLDTLGRSMNLIADEDDYLESLANAMAERCITWVREASLGAAANMANPQCRESVPREILASAPGDASNAESLLNRKDVSRETSVFVPASGGGSALGGAPAGFVLSPAFGTEPLVLCRRACFTALGKLLGSDVRVENAAVAAVLAAFDDNGKPKSGYVINIQGNLAVSANKRGVRVEPMEAFRARRKRC